MGFFSKLEDELKAGIGTLTGDRARKKSRTRARSALRSRRKQERFSTITARFNEDRFGAYQRSSFLEGVGSSGFQGSSSLASSIKNPSIRQSTLSELSSFASFENERRNIRHKYKFNLFNSVLGGAETAIKGYTALYGIPKSVGTPGLLDIINS